MKRLLTCIVCPKGCEITVETEDGAVLSVKGNTCERGERYAVAECTHPERTLTTTVATEDGGVLPVKTNRPVPKEMLFDCMDAVNKVVVPGHIHAGDVIIGNLLGTGADLIATRGEDV